MNKIQPKHKVNWSFMWLILLNRDTTVKDNVSTVGRITGEDTDYFQPLNRV